MRTRRIIGVCLALVVSAAAGFMLSWYLRFDRAGTGRVYPNVAYVGTWSARDDSNTQTLPYVTIEPYGDFSIRTQGENGAFMITGYYNEVKETGQLVLRFQSVGMNHDHEILGERMWFITIGEEKLVLNDSIELVRIDE